MNDNCTYSLGIYRRTKPFVHLPEVIGLEVCNSLYPEFFPAKFYISPKDFIQIEQPSDFSRDKAPEGYYGSDEVEMTFINGQDGSKLTFTITEEDLDIVPCGVVLNWKSIDNIPTVDRLEEMFKTLANTFEADTGRVSNLSFSVTNEIYDREVDEEKFPKLMEWITWLHPAHTQNIGAEKIEALKDIVRVQPFMDGYLVTLTDEPYDDTIPEHRKIRVEVEDRLGLTAIYEAGQN